MCSTSLAVFGVGARLPHEPATRSSRSVAMTGSAVCEPANGPSVSQRRQLAGCSFNIPESLACLNERRATSGRGVPGSRLSPLPQADALELGLRGQWARLGRRHLPVSHRNPQVRWTACLRRLRIGLRPDLCDWGGGRPGSIEVRTQTNLIHHREVGAAGGRWQLPPCPKVGWREVIGPRPSLPLDGCGEEYALAQGQLLAANAALDIDLDAVTTMWARLRDARVRDARSRRGRSG